MLLICTGVVFLILFITYLVYHYESNALKKQKEKALFKAYSGGRIKKIDYDLISYNGDQYSNNADINASQVTIDEMLGDKKDEGIDKFLQKRDDEIVTRIDYDGIEEIVGPLD
jgi:hypothetical protein